MSVTVTVETRWQTQPADGCSHQLDVDVSLDRGSGSGAAFRSRTGLLGDRSAGGEVCCSTPVSLTFVCPGPESCQMFVSHTNLKTREYSDLSPVTITVLVWVNH